MILKKYAVVLNAEYVEELDKIAKIKERSRSFMLRQAVENLLKGEKQNE